MRLPEIVYFFVTKQIRKTKRLIVKLRFGKNKGMKREEAIEKLKRKQALINVLMRENQESPKFKKWERDTGVVIKKIFGESNEPYLKFINIEYSKEQTWLDARRGITHNNQFWKGLEEARYLLQSFIDEIEEYWEDEPSKLGKEKSLKQWDVFISHAGEDRELFVNSLASKLEDAGLAVWYSESALKVGDSLRRSIDMGLERSRYGIVVISPAFLSKEWPQRELDGLAALEVGGRKVILPVWHEIEVEEVRQYSPTLADRVATSSKRGLEQVVADLLDAIELRTRKQNIAGTKSKSTVCVQDNLTEEELKLLLAVERSGNRGCYFTTLVQTLNISETRTKYFLDTLSRDRAFLNWIGNMNPNVPDRYTLTRKGRDFLVEGDYV